MNERIRELIKTKSTILFPGTDTVDCQISDIEKFAELIVQECCAITDEVERADLPVVASKFVKAHFGVE
jgi:hypothetical protein